MAFYFSGKTKTHGQFLANFSTFAPRLYTEGCENMYPNNPSGYKLEINKLIEIRQHNNRLRWLLCDYLNNTPNLIHKELIKSVNTDGRIPEEILYCSLLAGFFGLNPEENNEDKLLINDYLRLSVCQSKTSSYTRNPYYHNIQIPEVSTENWQLTYEHYAPYEAFIRNDLIITEDFREIPQIGFFTEEFRFPAVMQKGVEWMSIKPNEIETIQPIIDCVHGSVITFGLGLGYFAYMASLKQQVETITVIEHNEEVINLFNKHILPQFAHKGKIRVIQTDALDYIQNRLPTQQFDFAFVDLWHDVSDGLDIYLRIKKMEHLSQHTRFLYWIEEFLLSGLRWEIFDSITQNAHSYNEMISGLSDSFLRSLAASKVKLKFQDI